MSNKLEILDTTLRDGAQSEEISFSVPDKLAIALALERVGVDIIEAGNPGASPKDMLLFNTLMERPFHAKIAAFSPTRRKFTPVDEDPMMAAVIKSGVKIASIFGKSSQLQAEQVLGVDAAENLAMIGDSIRYLTQMGIDVYYDAEHFFDAFAESPAYAMDTLRQAAEAGAKCIVLCDTNGGCLPETMGTVVDCVRKALDVPIGIHAHNDMGLAVACSMAAVSHGATHVQGTFLGFGERCGNTCLSTLVPNLQLKCGIPVVSDTALKQFTAVARLISDISNRHLNRELPYVGRSAFAHKAGMHADAILKLNGAYEHVDPTVIGNTRHLPISEYAGRNAILARFPNLFDREDKDSPVLQEILQTVKDMELHGYQYEAAEASLELLIRRTIHTMPDFFELVDCKLIDQHPIRTGYSASAMIKVRVNGKEEFAAAEGDGPVHALDQAFRNALVRFYPSLSKTHLTDYKVRVLTPEAAAAAVVRVLIHATDGVHEWTTVGVSSDVIEASYLALRDLIEIKLLRDSEEA